jgi:multiple antibiotic resistance protein
VDQEMTLFIGTFTTLLAIINPFEAMPIFLKLLAGRDAETHRQVAWKSCVYAAILMFFFLVFGNLLLRVFGVPLSMVRIVGGIILTRIGFELFSPSSSGMMSGSGVSQEGSDVSFIPLAMPIMFGPGALATVMGMTSTVKSSQDFFASFVAVSLAIVATMLITCLTLLFSRRIMERIGAKGVDAATRMVGFFVSAMGMGLIFHGLIDALLSYGLVAHSSAASVPFGG